MIYANGDIYDGNWINGLFINGRIKKRNIVIETQNVFNNIPIGYGKIIYSNEKIYDGEIQNFMPNGLGKMIYYDEMIEVGLWKDGIFIGSKHILQQCKICAQHFMPKHLILPCGKCDNFICKSCNDKHYDNINNINTGDFNILVEKRILCPFCFTYPINKGLNLDNPILKILNESKSKKILKCAACQKIEDFIEPCNLENEILECNLKNFCKKCSGILIKKCPRCKIIIEKNGGCLHMYCMCGYNFCWNCKNEWSKCGHGNYSCNRV
jgi:hypothetical protein